VHQKGKLFILLLLLLCCLHTVFLSIIMAKIIDTFVTKSDKLVGQSNYNVWKLKVINLLLRKDLLDLIEVNTIVTSGLKKKHTKRNNKVLTIINQSIIDKIIQVQIFIRCTKIFSQCHHFLFFFT